MRSLREVLRRLRAGETVFLDRAEWSEPLFLWGLAVWNPLEGRVEVRPESLPGVEALLAEMESAKETSSRKRRLFLRGSDKGGAGRALFGVLFPGGPSPGVRVLTAAELPRPPFRLVRDFSLLLEVAREGYKGKLPLVYGGGGAFSAPPVEGAKEVLGEFRPPPPLVLGHDLLREEALALPLPVSLPGPLALVENLEPLLAPGLRTSLASLVVEGKEGAHSPPPFTFALYRGDGRFASATEVLGGDSFVVAPDLDPIGLRLPLHGKEPLAFREGFLGLLYPAKPERERLYARLATLPLLRRFENQLSRMNVDLFGRAGEPFASLWRELRKARVAVPQEAYLGSAEGFPTLGEMGIGGEVV